MSGSFFCPFCFSPGLCPLLSRSFPAPFPYLPAPSGLYIFQDCAPALPVLRLPCPICLLGCRMSLLPVFRRCLHMPLYSLFYLACFLRAARRHPPVFLIWLGSRVCPPSRPSRPFTPLHTSPRPPPSILLYALRDALSTHPDGWGEIMVKSLHCLAPSVPRPSSFSPYIAFLRLFVRRISSFVGMIP